jgi:transposase
MRDGRKRHVLTGTFGQLLEVHITPADVQDSVAAPELLDRFMAEPGRLLKLVWADSAYQGPALADAFARHGIPAPHGTPAKRSPTAPATSRTKPNVR